MKLKLKKGVVVFKQEFKFKLDPADFPDAGKRRRYEKIIAKEFQKAMARMN